MSLAVAVLPAPGPMVALTIGVTDAGLALVAFGDAPGAAERAAARQGTSTAAAGRTEAGEQLAAYLAGEWQEFTMPLDRSLTSGTQRRVLGADRRGGFGGGRATKEWLPAPEGVLPAVPEFP